MSEGFLLEITKIMPLWFLMLCIVFVGLRYGLRHIWDCIKELLLRFDAKEKERQARYGEIYRNYQEAVNNNTRAFVEFKEKFIFLEHELKEEFANIKNDRNGGGGVR